MTCEKQIPEGSQADNISNADCRDPKNNWPDERINGNSTVRYWGMDEPTFSMLLHFSSFMTMAVPFVGIVLPVVMWATNKNESPIIAAH